MPFPATPQWELEYVTENPWSENGEWLEFSTTGPLQKTIGAPPDEVFIADTDSFITGAVNYSFYTRRQFSSDAPVEVWGCIEGGQLGAAPESWRVGVSLDAGTANWRGYLAYYGGAIGKGYVIRRYDGGGTGDFTNIATGTGGYPHRIGIRIDGANVECYGSYDVGATWTLKSTVADTTYRGNFYIFFGVDDTTGGGLSFSCIGGGQPNRTQIYRVVQGLGGE